MSCSHHNIKSHHIWKNTLDSFRSVEYMRMNTTLKQDSPVEKYQFLELLHNLGKTI